MIRPVLSAVLLALLLGTPGRADEPYIFTQVHAGHEQIVSAGAAIQVQLPAGPARWQVDGATGNIEWIGLSEVASPGRIDGTDRIQVFLFRSTGDGPIRIVITSGNPPPALAAIVPDGRYELALQVRSR